MISIACRECKKKMFQFSHNEVEAELFWYCDSCWSNIEAKINTQTGGK